MEWAGVPKHDPLVVWSGVDGDGGCGVDATLVGRQRENVLQVPGSGRLSGAQIRHGADLQSRRPPLRHQTHRQPGHRSQRLGAVLRKPRGPGGQPAGAGGQVLLQRDQLGQSPHPDDLLLLLLRPVQRVVASEGPVVVVPGVLGRGGGGALDVPGFRALLVTDALGGGPEWLLSSVLRRVSLALFRCGTVFCVCYLPKIEVKGRERAWQIA